MATTDLHWNGLTPRAMDVAVSRDGLCQHNPTSDDEKIQLGRAAMERQRRRFEDWLLIAAALLVGQTETMRAVHTDQPKGRRYERAMAEWLTANGFKEIDKGARSRLLDCLQHREEIMRWRSTLTDGERLCYNHPQVVLARWKKSLAPTAPDPEPKPSPVAKLKETIAALEEENHRMRREIERGGGDLWTADDTPRDIARVIAEKFSPSKVERIARELLKLSKSAGGRK